jgi:hypothetical protein
MCNKKFCVCAAKITNKDIAKRMNNPKLNKKSKWGIPATSDEILDYLARRYTNIPVYYYNFHPACDADGFPLDENEPWQKIPSYVRSRFCKYPLACKIFDLSQGIEQKGSSINLYDFSVNSEIFTFLKGIEQGNIYTISNNEQKLFDEMKKYPQEPLFDNIHNKTKRYWRRRRYKQKKLKFFKFIIHKIIELAINSNKFKKLFFIKTN